MTYLARRLALFALTLLLISVVTFAITNILPGDVATMIMGTRGNPTSLAALRDKLGLNDPLIVQYGRWIGGMLTGDWGVSLRFKEPITELLAQKLTASAMIVEARTIASYETIWSITCCRSALERATTRHSRSPEPVMVWASSSSGISARWTATRSWPRLCRISRVTKAVTVKPSAAGAISGPPRICGRRSS